MNIESRWLREICYKADAFPELESILLVIMPLPFFSEQEGEECLIIDVL